MSTFSLNLGESTTDISSFVDQLIDDKCGLIQALHCCWLGHLLSKHVRKLYLLGKPSTNQKYLNQAKISPAAFLAQTALQLYDISPQRYGQSISDFVKSYYFQSEGYLQWRSCFSCAKRQRGYGISESSLQAISVPLTYNFEHLAHHFGQILAFQAIL